MTYIVLALHRKRRTLITSRVYCLVQKAHVVMDDFILPIGDFGFTQKAVDGWTSFNFGKVNRLTLIDMLND